MNRAITNLKLEAANAGKLKLLDEVAGGISWRFSWL